MHEFEISEERRSLDDDQPIVMSRGLERPSVFQKDENSISRLRRSPTSSCCSLQDASRTAVSTSTMTDSQENSVQCVAVSYVGPYRMIGGQAFLELTLQLLDGSEVRYLASRPAAKSLIEGLTLAENLARS